MSKENLEQFMNQIADSDELQAKIGEQIDAAALIALGAECGCEFNAEELQEAAELFIGEEFEGIAIGIVNGRMRILRSEAHWKSGDVYWARRLGRGLRRLLRLGP